MALRTSHEMASFIEGIKSALDDIAKRYFNISHAGGSHNDKHQQKHQKDHLAAL